MFGEVGGFFGGGCEGGGAGCEGGGSFGWFGEGGGCRFICIIVIVSSGGVCIGFSIGFDTSLSERIASCLTLWCILAALYFLLLILASLFATTAIRPIPVHILPPHINRIGMASRTPRSHMGTPQHDRNAEENYGEEGDADSSAECEANGFEGDAAVVGVAAVAIGTGGGSMGICGGAQAVVHVDIVGGKVVIGSVCRFGIGRFSSNCRNC